MERRSYFVGFLVRVGWFDKYWLLRSFFRSSDQLFDGHKSLPADVVQFFLSERRPRHQRGVYIRSIESRDLRRPVDATAWR